MIKNYANLEHEIEMYGRTLVIDLFLREQITELNMHLRSLLTKKTMEQIIKDVNSGACSNRNNALQNAKLLLEWFEVNKCEDLSDDRYFILFKLRFHGKC